jgi:hypothetical protein
MDRLMTDHACQRSAQRNVPDGVLEILLQYGDERPTAGGARRVEFGKAAKARIRKAFGPCLAEAILRTDKLYAIMKNGRILTVAFDKRNATR